MSPKTTPSAAKLKPAAPIAEAGLRFSAEILITRISMDHSIQPRNRAAEQRDELAASHSISSSASNWIELGTSMPSALAVCRLMTNSNLVDCTTGISAGFAPLRI